MHGIKETPWEPDATRKELVLKAIADTIDIDDTEECMNIAKKIPIKSTSRVGCYSSLKSRPICISFSSKGDADTLMEWKKSLKKGIYVDREYSKEDEMIRKKLLPILRAARSKESYRGKCKMEGATLIIKGKKYTLSNLHDLPDDLNTFNVSSKSTDTVLGFFSELNPLSNFYPSMFTHEGIQYHSSEQFIQYSKAVYFKDTATASKILKCDTPIECKSAARNIANFNMDNWRTNAESICESGIRSKFEQNFTLKHLLQGTGTKTLVECCKDSLWGTGIPLNAPDCLNPDKWHNQGILGQILECIRASLGATLGINMDTEP